MEQPSTIDPHVVIVGAGIVGSATGFALHDIGRNVRFVEVDPTRRAELEPHGLPITGRIGTLVSRTIVMLCVETPADTDGFRLDALERGVRDIGAAISPNTDGIIVAVRATVPPGTCERVEQWLSEVTNRRPGEGYDVVCMPEFLRQATSLEDAKHPRTIVIAARNPQVIDTMVDLVRPLGGSVHTTSSFVDAEMIKCAHNAYNATKISFWNEIHLIAEQVGADSALVARIVSESAEASWNPAYGTRGGRPYEGSCLPKDVVGFAAHAASAGVTPIILEAVERRNSTLDSSAGG